MKIYKAIGGLLGAGALVFALAGTATAVVDYATVSGHMASTSANNDPSFWGTDCSAVDGVDGLTTYTLTQNYSKVIVKAGSTNQGDPNSLTIFDNPTSGQTVWADTDGNNLPPADDTYPGGDKNISHMIVCGPSSSSSSSSESSASSTSSESSESSASSTSSESSESSASSTSSESSASSTSSESSSTSVTTSFTGGSSGESTTSSNSETTSFTGGSSGESTTTHTLPQTSTFGDTSNPTDHSWMLIAALGMFLGSALVLAPARTKNRR